MSYIGGTSYLLCAILFLFLFLLLITSWRGRLQGALLAVACGVTTIWAATLAYAAVRDVPVSVVEVLEILRDAGWLIFLSRLLSGLEDQLWLKMLRTAAYIVPIGLAGLAIYTVAGNFSAPLAYGIDGRFVIGALVAVLTALVLLEQLYRNLRPDRRWAIKYLCLGVGAMFAFDLYLYSYALLFHRVDVALWDARGVVNAFAVPLIAVSAARNPSWSLDIFVSRRAAFHTAALMGAGIYLLVMSIGGYYIRVFGGNWGAFAQALFLSGAVIVLATVLFSGQVRAQLRVFLSKHFFNYKYDYREEWLRLIGSLTDVADDLTPYDRAIRAVAQILESPGGGVWLAREGTGLVPAGRWKLALPEDTVEPETAPMATFLHERRWIIDLAEYRSNPQAYGGLELPRWLLDMERAWLVMPLLQHEALSGFMVLLHPHAAVKLTWEDRDLLKTLGRQIASYLGQHESAQALSQARQFETFNRLTAFVMHDLKNLIAQQSLVVKNAAKYKDNPAFIEDAIMTIDNSVRRMNRLLEQLQRGQRHAGIQRVEVGRMLEQVVARCADRQPQPTLDLAVDGVMVAVEPEGFAMVLGHVVRNAQDATSGDGHVHVRAGSENGHIQIEVEDDGVGMDATFVRECLFRPFYTTKSSKGMGIGAYQTREFIRAAGGQLDVISRPGEGTRFRITLPACETNTDVDANAGIQAVK